LIKVFHEFLDEAAPTCAAASPAEGGSREGEAQNLRAPAKLAVMDASAAALASSNSTQALGGRRNARGSAVWNDQRGASIQVKDSAAATRGQDASVENTKGKSEAPALELDASNSARTASAEVLTSTKTASGLRTS
jgi:hypothetical protein